MKHACFFCCLTLSEKKHLWENFVNSSKPIEVPKTSQLLKIPKTSCAMKLPWLLWLFLASASADCVGRDQPTATMPRQLSVNGTASDSNGVHHAHHNLALESMLPISCWLGDWLTQQALAVFFKQQFCDVCPQETIHVGKFHLLFFKAVVPLTSTKDWELVFVLFVFYSSIPPKKDIIHSSTKHVQQRGWLTPTYQLQVVLWFWLSCCPAPWKPSTSLSSQCLSVFFFSSRCGTVEPLGFLYIR